MRFFSDPYSGESARPCTRLQRITMLLQTHFEIGGNWLPKAQLSAPVYSGIIHAGHTNIHQETVNRSNALGRLFLLVVLWLGIPSSPLAIPPNTSGAIPRNRWPLGSTPQALILYLKSLYWKFFLGLMCPWLSSGTIYPHLCSDILALLRTHHFCGRNLSDGKI